MAGISIWVFVAVLCFSFAAILLLISVMLFLVLKLSSEVSSLSKKAWSPEAENRRLSDAYMPYPPYPQDGLPYQTDECTCRLDLPGQELPAGYVWQSPSTDFYADEGFLQGADEDAGEITSILDGSPAYGGEAAPVNGCFRIVKSVTLIHTDELIR